MCRQIDKILDGCQHKKEKDKTLDKPPMEEFFNK